MGLGRNRDISIIVIYDLSTIVKLFLKVHVFLPHCRNGRDVHRELYGFYFLMDASIAIYEFRQFGKK